MTSARLIARACLVPVSASLAVLAIGVVLTARAAGSGCDRQLVTRVVSPGGSHAASVVEMTCGAGGLAPDITAELRIDGTVMLGVDTGGHEEDRPRIAWASASALDVTVPNLSYLRVLRRQTEDVGVRLHFQPDEPAARLAWLRDHHLPPDAARP